MDNSKYYFAERKGDQAYPLVAITNFNSVKFGRADILDVIIESPIPQNPVMGDFLTGHKDLFSPRIAKVMKALNMEGVNFYPAVMEHKKTKYDYVCVSVDDNTFPLLDKEKSIFSKEEDSPMYYFKKLVIDREKLKEIPLNKRLAMRLKEAAGRYLYHQSVVDAIMALEPTGVRFIDIEEYEF